jgi:hypothetical protein
MMMMIIIIIKDLVIIIIINLIIRVCTWWFVGNHWINAGTLKPHQRQCWSIVYMSLMEIGCIPYLHLVEMYSRIEFEEWNPKKNLVLLLIHCYNWCFYWLKVLYIVHVLRNRIRHVFYFDKYVFNYNLASFVSYKSNGLIKFLIYLTSHMGIVRKFMDLFRSEFMHFRGLPCIQTLTCSLCFCVDYFLPNKTNNKITIYLVWLL